MESMGYMGYDYDPPDEIEVIGRWADGRERRWDGTGWIERALFLGALLGIMVGLCLGYLLWGAS